MLLVHHRLDRASENIQIRDNRAAEWDIYKCSEKKRGIACDEVDDKLLLCHGIFVRVGILVVLKLVEASGNVCQYGTKGRDENAGEDGRNKCLKEGISKVAQMLYRREHTKMFLNGP